MFNCFGEDMKRSNWLMKSLVAGVMMVSALSAHAIDTRNLSKEQINRLEAVAIEMSKEKADDAKNVSK
jgi:hypothetical protein